MMAEPQRRPTTKSPSIPPLPAAELPAAAPRIYVPPPPEQPRGPKLQDFLKHDEADPDLIAELPCALLLHDAPTFERLERELRALHGKASPGQPLLKAQSRDRSIFRYWKG